jgi:hypothetical protein
MSVAASSEIRPNQFIPPRHDDIKWCGSFLQKHPEVYAAFSHAASQIRAVNPDAPFSVDAIIQDLRWKMESRERNGRFTCNNNARALMARLYKRAYPDAKLEMRKSWLDTLQECEWQQILGEEI